MPGTSDTTAIGSDIAPPDVQGMLGRYDALGRQRIGRVPKGRLIDFTGLGHAPQTRKPERFLRARLDALLR